MKQLDPKFVKKTFILTMISFFICITLLTGVVIATGVDPTSVVIFSIFTLIILSVCSWLVIKLIYRFYWYELQEEGFYKESGILWKNYVSIPYARVQNVNICRGPLDRLFNLSRLYIFTAGTSSLNYMLAEGKLPGLSVKTAEELKKELIKRSNQIKSSSGV